MITKHWLWPVVWPYPFSIQHWTPDLLLPLFPLFTTADCSECDAWEGLRVICQQLDSTSSGGQSWWPPVWRTQTTVNDPYPLIDMLHHWHDAVDKGQSVHAVFVDFAKAFDHVDHNVGLLVIKMLRFGLSDTVMCWISFDTVPSTWKSVMYCPTGYRSAQACRKAPSSGRWRSSFRLMEWQLVTSHTSTSTTRHSQNSSQDQRPVACN